MKERCKHLSIDNKTCRIIRKDCAFRHFDDTVDKTEMCNRERDLIWYLKTIGVYDNVLKDEECLTEVSKDGDS